MNNHEVSRNLIKLRLQNNWTQDDLAKKLSISRQAVSKWETATALPNIDVLLALSKIYNISINEIVEPRTCNLITDFEEVRIVDAYRLKELLKDVDMSLIVIASMGASPETFEFIETVFFEIDFVRERANIGRIQIEKVIEAEKEIIKILNQEIAQI